MPVHIIMLNQAWEGLINMLIWPLFFLAFGIFYLELRVRSEALDLNSRLDVLIRDEDRQK